MLMRTSVHYHVKVKMFIYIFSRIYCIPIFSLDDFNKYTENIELQNNISLRGLAKN